MRKENIRLLGENNIRLSRENTKICSRPMRRIRRAICKCANLRSISQHQLPSFGLVSAISMTTVRAFYHLL
ncbi:hypothetical protein LEMLEM_LOCUS17909 [Lemmus lemmus]